MTDVSCSWEHSARPAARQGLLSRVDLPQSNSFPDHNRYAGSEAEMDLLQRQFGDATKPRRRATAATSPRRR